MAVDFNGILDTTHQIPSQFAIFKWHLSFEKEREKIEQIDRTIVSVQKIEITATVVAALVPTPPAPIANNKKKDKEKERQKAISFLMRIYYH